MLASRTAVAAIVVVPSVPLSGQAVHIRLVTQYSSETVITSATISRSGNQFTINQAVSESCFLPSAPLLVSDFDVGVLPAGTYQVTAIIQNTRPCGSFTATEAASFSVVDPQAVPVGGPVGYAALAWMLAFLGLRRFGSSKA